MHNYIGVNIPKLAIKNSACENVIYKVQNEFMAHAVANEWRSQKEVILLSQVMTFVGRK